MNEVSFGPFVLSLAQRQVWRDGVRIPLTAREAELLGLLVERRPHIIGKDELIERLWRGAATDAALAQTVYRLRQKLGRPTGTHGVIRTIPDVGFQFTGDWPPESQSELVEVSSAEFACYQRAVEEYRQRTKASLLSAIRSLEHLAESNPRFPYGLLTLARAHAVLGIRLFRNPQDSYCSARRALKQVLDSDPLSAEAHATLATVVLFYDGDREQAHRAAEHAQILAPHSLFARKAVFWERISQRDFAGALTQADLMVRSAPASVQPMALLATALYFGGRYDEARTSFDLALELDPLNCTALYYGAAASIALEDYDRAERFLSAADRAGVAGSVDALRGVLAARRGDQNACAEMVSRLSASGMPSNFALCAIAIARKDFARALSLLDAASKTREPSQFLLVADPIYAPLLHEYPAVAQRPSLRLAAPVDF